MGRGPLSRPERSSAAVLEFRRQRDGEEAETQGRSAAARSSDESPSWGFAQGQAQEGAFGSGARSGDRADRRADLLELVRGISPLWLLLAGGAGFVLAEIVLVSYARASLPVAVAWLLAIVALLGLVGCALGSLKISGVLDSEALVRARDLRRDTDAIADRLDAANGATRAAEALLAASPSPLLVIDDAYQVVASYSPQLEAFFRVATLRDENFLNLLRRVLPEPRFEVARDYLATLFDPKKSDDELPAGNPLREVEIMLLDSDASSVPRTLSFTFRRVAGGAGIERALVAIDDVTERLRREHQARVADATRAKHFDLLVDLLGVRSQAIDGFASAAHDELHAIDDALRAGDGPYAAESEAFRERVAEVLRRVRAIKQGAIAAGIPYFVRRTTDYERKVEEIERRDSLGGNDFLSLVMEQSAFRTELDDLQELRARIDTPKGAGLHDLESHTVALAQRLARHAGKEVVVEVEGLNTDPADREQRELIASIVEELTRNAIAHGIETPGERSVHGKPAAGLIQIVQGREAHGEGRLILKFRDDGAGLDLEALRERAIDAGLLDAGSTRDLDETEVAGFVFAPELSRGMSEVKRRVVDENGGSISVDSEPGVFCEFSFVLPSP